MAKTTRPKKSPASRGPAAYYWDLELLDAWSARRPAPCPWCHEHLNPAQPESMISHMLLHGLSPETRADLEQLHAIMRNWDKLSVEAQTLLLSPSISGLRNNAATFEELQRMGIVTRVSGEN